MVNRQASRKRRLADQEHRPGVVVLRGDLTQRCKQGRVVALLGEVGNEGGDEVSFADCIENVCCVHQFGRRVGGRLRQ